jgi:hypothetical protein
MTMRLLSGQPEDEGRRESAMLNRLGHGNTLLRAGAVRRHLLLWLFALFAGFEIPLGGHEPDRARSVLEQGASRHAAAILPAEPIFERHQPEAQDTAWQERGGLDDATHIPALPSHKGLSPFLATDQAPFALAHQRPGFDSRAPPARSA